RAHVRYPRKNRLKRRKPSVRVAFHADDLGFSPSITDGICDALRNGILTGASIIATGLDAARALLMWKAVENEQREGSIPSWTIRSRLGDSNKPFDLGVHLNLSQGKPLTGACFPTALLDRRGAFRGLHTILRLLCPDATRYVDAVRHELKAQIE